MFKPVHEMTVKHGYLLPLLLAALVMPGYMGGAAMVGRHGTMLAVALSALLACWYWYRQPGLLVARLGPWRYVALALILPLVYAALQALTGPAHIPETGASWAETGPFGGTLAPSKIMFHVFSLASLLLTGLITFLAANDRKAAHWIVTAVLAFAAGWSILGAAAYYSSGSNLSELFTAIDRPRYRFLSGPFVNRGHFGSYAGAAAVIAAALFTEYLHHDRKRFLEARAQGLPGSFAISWKTAALAALIIAMMVIVLETAARGALLAAGTGMALAAGVFAVRGRGRERTARLAFLAAAVVAVLPVLWLIAGDNLEKRMPYTGLASDFSESRYALWRPGLAALEDRPVTGWGLGAYGEVARIYAVENRGARISRAHNEYLDLAVGWGIPATLAWIGGLAYIGWGCLRGALTRRRDWALPLAASAVMIHFAVHSLIDFPLYIPANALLFAMVLGVGAAQAASSHSGEQKRKVRSSSKRRHREKESDTQFLRMRIEPGAEPAHPPHRAILRGLQLRGHPA